MKISNFKLLILGGTADGKKLALELHNEKISVVYSIAGLVRIPEVPCELIIGGFTQFGGLTQFIKVNNIDAVLDVTHPFAQNMSKQAIKSASESQIPCLRYQRLPWAKQAGDQWYEFENWHGLIDRLKDKKSVFLTAGQLEQVVIDQLGSNKNQRQVLRTAVKPKVCLPKTMTWIKAIGPFKEKEETELLASYAVDALVCKDSGGESTEAKLHAARKKGIPVFMHKRPDLGAVDFEFQTLNDCKEFIRNYKE